MNIAELTRAATPWGPRARRLDPASIAVAAIAVAAFAVEMTVSARYGYVRDELYFLAAGHHPALGYVDQPALTPLLARLTAALTGNTLAGLRLLPALGLAALVLMTAAMAATAGASRTGRTLAALAAAVCAEFVGAMHELTTTTPDFVLWALTLLLVMRLLASRDRRWWLAIGAAAGLAATAKWNIGFLVLALLAGFAVSRGSRDLLRSRYLVLGGLLFAALAAPDLIWQAAHGWPNLEVFRHLNQQAWHNRIVYLPAQVLFTGLVLTPVWIAGLAAAVRSERWRPVGVACAIVIVLQFVLGGKPYYSGGAYTFLLAYGATAISSRARFTARSARWLGAAMIAGGIIAAPIAIPVLPARALHFVPLQKINYDLAESIAWPREVALIAREYLALPSGERAHTAILTGNYGEAGALDRYGAGSGLPTAYSGANNFWLWGPPPAADTAAIAINVDPALLHREFAHVTLVATFDNGLGVADDEQGAVIYLATGLRAPWSVTWPAFRDYA